MHPLNFITLLRELDPCQAAQHSTMNHHVNGLQYLCLFRDPKLTVKLYFLDPRLILDRKPGEWLVIPHSHRYSFQTTVLVGSLRHVRFHEFQTGLREDHPHRVRDRFERFSYHPETRTRSDPVEVNLGIASRFYYVASHSTHEDCWDTNSYWCNPDHVHTLEMPDRLTMLGLVQYSDVRATSNVYLKPGQVIQFPDSRIMTIDEAKYYRDYALDLLKARP